MRLFIIYILTTTIPNMVRPYRYDDARAAPKGALIYNSEPTLPVQLRTVPKNGVNRDALKGTLL